MKQLNFEKNVNPVTSFLESDRREKKKESQVPQLMRDRVRVYMKYINSHDLSMSDQNLRFCDLEEELNLGNILVVQWFYRELYKDFNIFFNECLNYKEDYPIAFQKILPIFEKRKTNLFLEDFSRKLSFSERTKLFMAYSENEKVPSSRSEVRFCDIDKSIIDSARMGIWIQHILTNSEQTKEFQQTCLKYQNIYPKAYQKIQKKLTNIQLSFSERIKALMRYLETHPGVTMDRTLTFRDICLDAFDNGIVQVWVQKQLAKNYEEFVKECCLYHETYPKAYSKLLKKFQEIEHRKQSAFLSNDQRMQIYLRYLSEKQTEMVKKQDGIRFCDLDNTVSDFVLVSSWVATQLRYHFNEFKAISEKYREVYPVGYQKLENRIVTYRSNISYEEKMRLFMRYVDTHPIVKQLDSLRFCDLDEQTLDTSLVGVWFLHSLSATLSLFIKEYSKYQEIYPVAYQKVSQKINQSGVRLKKSRICLVEELQKVRDSLVKLEEPHKKKLIKK